MASCTQFAQREDAKASFLTDHSLLDMGGVADLRTGMNLESTKMTAHRARSALRDGSFGIGEQGIVDERESTCSREGWRTAASDQSSVSDA